MTCLCLLLAAASEGGDRPAGGGWDVMILYLAPLIVILYFLLIRPQKKREQERKAMLGRIKKGERVYTVGGICGEVVKLNEREVVLLVDKKKGVELRFMRSAVSSVIGPKDGEGEKEGGGRM